MTDKIELGSQTAKAGFQNEKEIAGKFNNWQIDADAQNWLTIMSYDIRQIEHVKATVISGHKADINVLIQIKMKNAYDTENIQVKLVSNDSGYNQIDKRWLKSYNELWNIPCEVYRLLQYFTGELKPYRRDTRDNRRMFANEFTAEEQTLLLSWFEQNKILILSDILRGRGLFSAEWYLVINKSSAVIRWTLKNINDVLQHYLGNGAVSVSPKGSFYIGNVTIQRKGGDNGRETAKMLQFKINPAELFD